MVRSAMVLVGGALLLPAARGDELLMPPVAYGEAAKFWQAHALVVATVEGVRLENDGRSLEVREHLGLRVQESIPEKYAPGSLLPLTVERLVSPVRDRPQGFNPHFRRGDRLLLLVAVTKAPIALGGYVRQEDAEGRVIRQKEIASYAMMPGGAEFYRFTDERDSVVAETKKLCRAISTQDVRNG